MASFTVTIDDADAPRVTGCLAVAYGFPGDPTADPAKTTEFVTEAIAAQLIAQVQSVETNQAQAAALAALTPPPPPQISIAAG